MPVVDAALALEHKAKGNAFFKAQQWQQAIDEFSKAIELDDTQHVFFSNRSACNAGLGDYASALQDAESCIAVKPDWAKGYSRKGLALHNLNRFPEAVETYDQGLAIDGTNAALLEGKKTAEAAAAAGPANPFGAMFAEDKVMAKMTTDPALMPLLGQADFMAKLRQVQQNPNTINQHLQDPRMMKLLSALMGINMNMGGDGQQGEPDQDTPMSEATPEPTPQPKKAEPEVTEEDKNAAEAIEAKNQGNAAYKKRQFDEAIQHYSRAMELDPKNPMFLTNRSAVFFEIGDFDKCMEDCEQAVALQKKHYAPPKWCAKAYYRMANVFLKRDNDIEKAINFMDKSLLEDRSSVVSKKLRELKDRKQKLSKEAYLDPVKGEEARKRGNVLFGEQNWREAVSEYSEAVQRNPRDHKAFSNRAACFAKLMNWRDALKDCASCLEIEPSFVKAYLRRGKIQHLCKEFHKALDSYDAALEFDPDAAEVKEARMQTMNAVQQQNMTEIDPQRRERAMNDPQIQFLLKDPQVTQALNAMQSDPSAARKLMSDPALAKKIDRLIAAGVLQAR